jgi:hypothetical protein
MRHLAIALLAVGTAQAQIVTRNLSADAPIPVVISVGTVTTLLFPGKVSGTFGGNLATIDPSKPEALPEGQIAVEHPAGSQIVLLEPSSSAPRGYMTVFVGGALYVFDLIVGSHPDVAVTLTQNDPGTEPREVTPEEIKNEQRVHYDPELMHDLLRRASNAVAMRKLYPDLYKGYASREVAYVSDNGSVRTTVSQISRFSLQDAVVLHGTIQNEASAPLTFDGRSAVVEVANETHSVRMFYAPRPIAAGASVPFEALIQGDIHGYRANLSVDNEFRLILPPSGDQTWLKIGPPAPARAIPLTQTGSPKKEQQ